MRTARCFFAVAALACLATALADEELKIADMATVKVDGAQVRMGTKVLATLSKGQKVKIHYVQGGFARVWIKLEGKPTVGYMNVRDLEAPPRTEKKTAQVTFKVDDEVIVIAKEAKLMMGTETLGTIPEGTRLTVKKLKEPWLGVFADVKGKSTFGWVHSRDVDYPPFRDKESPPKKDATETPRDKGAAKD